MKKTSKKSKELTVDNTVEERHKWTTLLEHASMFHQQVAMEHRSDILGAEPDTEELFHLACSSAIEDAILLIQMASEQGMFDEIPQYKQGPAG